MLIRWLNDDQRLEQAEPCWSPRGKRCSPSSWESVQTRSKQIVRKINSWGFRPRLGVKVKGGWRLWCAWRDVWKTGVFLGQFRLCLQLNPCTGMKEAEAEVKAALVSWKRHDCCYSCGKKLSIPFVLPYYSKGPYTQCVSIQWQDKKTLSMTLGK